MHRAQKQASDGSDSSFPRVIDAMNRAEFYPHYPDGVEMKQTHISYVFMAGEYVYKVKKPVRFHFLDYSTPVKRRHFCREEVRLNRRLASGVYLGVVPIVRKGEGFALKDGGPLQGNAIAEYAVKMHRLPEDRMLDSLLRQGKVEREDLRAIAKRLVTFHKTASEERAPVYGAWDVIRRKMLANFQETEQFLGRTISEKEFGEIREYSERFLEENRDLVERRVREGRIREGHGDLRAEHICLIDDIVVFDCIEFSEELRTGDVASEIAFLAMDLDFLGAPVFSQEWVAQCAELAEDRELFCLLPFYKCYRAYVRGKVESLKSVAKELSDEEQNNAVVRARRYFRLAHGYATTCPQPALVVVCGMVATGKSTIARKLGDRTGFPVLRSDFVRKQIAHIPAEMCMSQGYRSALYSDEFTRLTYRTLLAEAERHLKSGKGVIVDATFQDSRHRRWALKLAADLKVPILFVECQAGEGEILFRLKERQGRPEEVSEATWDIYVRQREEVTPLSDVPGQCHVVLDTEKPIGRALETVENFICRP